MMQRDIIQTIVADPDMTAVRAKLKAFCDKHRVGLPLVLKTLEAASHCTKEQLQSILQDEPRV